MISQKWQVINLDIYHVQAQVNREYEWSLPRQAVPSNLRTPVKSVSAQNSQIVSYVANKEF